VRHEPGGVTRDGGGILPDADTVRFAADDLGSTQGVAVIGRMTGRCYVGTLPPEQRLADFRDARAAWVTKGGQQVRVAGEQLP